MGPTTSRNLGTTTTSTRTIIGNTSRMILLRVLVYACPEQSTKKLFSNQQFQQQPAANSQQPAASV
jgi:hypothetical protein